MNFYFSLKIICYLILNISKNLLVVSNLKFF